MDIGDLVITNHQIRRYLYLILALSFAAGVWAGKQAEAPKYDPTEVEQLRLEVAQRDAQLAQTRAQMACRDLPQQGQFQQALAALNAEATKVREAHKWPDSVQFNPDSLKFYMGAPVPPQQQQPTVQPAPKVEPTKP